jgi:hypothetical protein
MYITRFKGGKYIENVEKETRLKKCVFFIRNDDDNCLYAALFVALAKRDNKVILDGTEYTFTYHDFETNRSLSNYAEKSKTENLRFYTLKLKALLEQDDDATDE